MKGLCVQVTAHLKAINSDLMHTLLVSITGGVSDKQPTVTRVLLQFKHKHYARVSHYTCPISKDNNFWHKFVTLCCNETKRD